MGVNAGILKGFVPDTLLFISYALILLSRIDSKMAHFCIFIQLFVAGVTHLYLYRRLKRLRIYNKLMVCLIFFGGILLLNLLLVGNIMLKMILYAVIIMPSISMLIFFCRVRIGWLYSIFLFAIGFIAIRWLEVGDLNLITVNSQNYIGFYLVIYALPYYFSCYRDNILPNIVFPIATLVVSIFAIGRGGIIVSLILMIGWFVEYLNGANGKKYRFLVMGIVAVIAICMVVSITPSDFVGKYFSRFAKKGFRSSVRSGLIDEYVKSLKNIFNLLLGTKLDDSLPLINFWGDSVHNSYLNTHARMGIFSLLYYNMIIGGLASLCRNKRVFFTFYYVAVLVKAFVDSDFPGTPVGGDIYIWLLFLMLFAYKETKAQKKISQIKHLETNRL